MLMIFHSTNGSIPTNTSFANVHTSVRQPVAIFIRRAVIVFKAVYVFATSSIWITSEQSWRTSTLANMVSCCANSSWAALQSCTSRNTLFSSLWQSEKMREKIRAIEGKVLFSELPTLPNDQKTKICLKNQAKFFKSCSFERVKCAQYLKMTHLLGWNFNNCQLLMLKMFHFSKIANFRIAIS